MSDIIQLLPDHLANQIAAGEVIQRPASAVKELIENAVDAGATAVHLILKDAGKELIQVVDNGKGMSAMDARMSFERHATSKIKKIEDLFEIRTKGFRGEALASIAAVAQVILKTRREEDALGTHIEIASSAVSSQEPVAFAGGTSISVKNLFFNVPARRHFLKSNTTELKHVLDEFIRIALAHPDIAFRFTNNGIEQYNLPGGNLKQRILALLGAGMDKNLIPVEELTDVVQIRGFIGKPEAANRTRGNQFFFINNRFIKSAYLNHAVSNAFEGLIAKDAFPTYILFLEIDPRKVDVNVHPTKQEVKFDDDKIMYAYLQAAIKFALNKYNVAPSIDFSLDASIQNLDALKMPMTEHRQQEVKQGYLYDKFSNAGQAHFIERREDRKQWQQQQKAFFPEMPGTGLEVQLPATFDTPSAVQPMLLSDQLMDETGSKSVIQWTDYLITTMKSGVVLLHQKRALERIIFEKLEERMLAREHVSQQLLFPIDISLSPSDALLLNEVLSELYLLGYDIKPGAELHDYVIVGVPSDIRGGQEQQMLEWVLEQIKNESGQVTDERRTILLRTMSKKMAVPRILPAEQAQSLVDELFACSQPQYTPDGKLIFRILSQNDLSALL
ncbi:MAG: DNA mismatch repair endonuclease MutL [Taibaiella sp.]|nr:DNA mismatch repair endonuclease MutL [Taibaiella sp.]